MTYFEDQEEAWYRNGCKGRIEDQDLDDVEEVSLCPACRQVTQTPGNKTMTTTDPIWNGLKGLEKPSKTEDQDLNDVEEVSLCPACQQVTHGEATCTKCGAGKVKP